MTPLMWAVKNDALRVLNVLLGNKKAQTTINMRDKQGNTALILATMATTATEKRRLEMARKLLEKGAKPNIWNTSRKNAFFYAEQAGDTKMTNLLLHYMPPRLQQKPIRKYPRPPMTTMPIPSPRYETK